MAKKKKKDGPGVIASNRKARHDYNILDTYEAVWENKHGHRYDGAWHFDKRCFQLQGDRWILAHSIHSDSFM